MEIKEDPIDKRNKQLKELTLVRNIHNLNPSLSVQNENDGINIINALKSNNLVQEISLQLKGYFYDPSIKKYVSYRTPVMNERGIGNFISDISTISQTIEFSSFKEKEIPKLVSYLFKINYPFYTIYYDEYNLDRKDFNLIATMLFTFILSSFKKAQGSGHRNVIRGTYSEDLLGRYATSGMKEESEKNKSGLAFLNPFKKAKGGV